MSEKGLLSAASFDNRNATYQYILGKFYHYSSEFPDLNKATRHYRNSLQLSPLQAGCWLDLSKAYLTAGLTRDADAALNKAIKLNPKNPAIMWETGVFCLMKSNVDMAVKAFKKFILLEPEGQEDVYDMLWKLQLEPHDILTNLIPDSYPYYRGYLLYLISTERITESKELWNRIELLPKEDELYLRYTDFLISEHLYEDAERVWKVFTDRKFIKRKESQPSLLWNSSFDLDMQNSGFDWRVGKADGVKIFLERDVFISGSRSLGVTFDGTQNPDITVASQFVRVIPGAKYLLRGYIKSNSLTTTNGLFLSVAGYDCRGLYKKSDAVTGTNLWKELSIEFETPPACSIVSINIKRERSYKLDNKISGIAWVDEISLVQR